MIAYLANMTQSAPSSFSDPPMGHRLQTFLGHHTALLHGGMGIGILGLAFVAGMVGCFLCPFTLPTAVGLAGISGARGKEDFKTALLLPTAFSVGLIGTLTAFGILAGEIGYRFSKEIRPYWPLALALLAILAAVVLLGRHRTEYARSCENSFPPRKEIGGTLASGAVFSVGTPLAGLFLVLSLASSGKSPAYATLIAFMFAMGRALPFWLAGTFSGLFVPKACSRIRTSRIRMATVFSLFVVAAWYLWLSKDLF
jgi:cytochrome c-type biogenesis protein